MKWGHSRFSAPAIAVAAALVLPAPSVLAEETQASKDPLAPLAFLSGSCFLGTFADGKTQDLVCYEPMLGGTFLRSRHRVLNEGAPYSGETILGRNARTGKLEYTYYNSLGGVLHGEIVPTRDGLSFPAEKIEIEGVAQELRSTWRKTDDGYVAASERNDGSGFKPFTTITFVRKGPASEWTEE